MSINVENEPFHYTKIDTKITHVTKAGSNIFLDLGFDEQEANYLQAKLNVRVIKNQLMGEIVVWIKDNKLKQIEAAKILQVSRPRVSDIVNKRLNKFTIDHLMLLLILAKKSIKITID